jgi:hypothetical protein
MNECSKSVERCFAALLNRPEMEFRANNENPVNWVKEENTLGLHVSNSDLAPISTNPVPYHVLQITSKNVADS